MLLAKICSSNLQQFQSAFTPEANTNIPDKGPSTHPTMEPIKISREGVYKLIKNINPSKATGYVFSFYITCFSC
jgi:hypothetical protein